MNPGFILLEKLLCKKKINFVLGASREGISSLIVEIER